MSADNAEVLPVAIVTLEDYLSRRKLLIASREVFFSALRTYLRPGQRPDARMLGDQFWNADARQIDDNEWVVNAARGYLTVLESDTKGRVFRLSVLLQGNELRVGVRTPAGLASPTFREPIQRVLTTFGRHEPVMTTLRGGPLFLDWHFPADRLYTQAQAMEDAVFRVGALFEAAIQAFTPNE